VRFGTVLVRGPSMVPALRDGDWLVVLRGGRIRPGQVVVARFRSRPELLVVKRAISPEEGGWLLASDNPFAEGPTGVADVEARVLLRYWPLRRRTTVRPRPSR
jgi:phage repressor protein C with HTH and peptisase S24 domain